MTPDGGRVITAGEAAIAQVQCFPIEVTLRRSFFIARKGADAGTPAETGARVLVRVEMVGGTVGWGECAPVPHWMGQTWRAVVSSIEHYLKPVVVGEDGRALRRLHKLMGAALPGPDSNYAKCALDVAFHDAAGNAHAVPADQFLRGGRIAGAIPSMFGIGLNDPKESSDRAVEAESRGFRLIKLKFIGEPTKDGAVVRAVREALSDQTDICVDANEAYNRADAIRVCGLLGDLGVLWIEQPLARHDLRGHAGLRRATSVPVMLDESITTAADLQQAAATDALDLVFFKLEKAGGLLPSADLLAVAEANGIAVVAGGILQTSIGTAALAHLASTVPSLRWGAFHGPLMLSDDIATGLSYRDGSIVVPTGPGLGVAVDESQVRTRSEEFRSRAA